MPTPTYGILDGLNSEQNEAVTASDGPVLVLAGAGSGKTRVIIHRIAYLIRERGVSPDTILAVTFTNKAADEMRRRVGSVLGAPEQGLWLHTFHALCLRLHRRFGEDVGLPRGFTVYGEDDRRALIRRLLQDLKLSEREFPVPRVGAALSRLKHRSHSGSRRAETQSWDPFQQAVASLLARYQAELERQKACDFDDLLLRGVELFECSERAREFAARHFQHVLVDEYQDTNRVQYRLLRHLAPHHNLFVVGDEDQSIYNFRGADLRNILDFERDFKDARVVKLELNYRSTGAILRAASSVIRRNQERKGKKLKAHLEEGERPEVHAACDERAEAAFVAERLEKLRAEAGAMSAAILLRTHAQTRVFEEELVARNLPHQVVGGLRFYERREIKDVLAYARLVINPDDDASFLRAVNNPQRGVGAQSLAIVRERAAALDLSLAEAAANAVDERLISGRASLGIAAFSSLLGKLRERARRVSPSRLLSAIASESGLLAAIEREDERTRRDRKENLEQLVAAAAEYETSAQGASTSLADFIDRVSLLSDGDAVSEQSPCLLMTLHAAKGLEFDVVFLAGLEEGLFPHIRASGDTRAIEEERRLFYVGMTRAKRRLFLSYARSRRFSYLPTDRSPSRFLAELGDVSTFGEPAVAVPVAMRGSGSEAETGGRRSSRSPALKLRPGALVRHEKFGEGRVVDASGSGRDRRVTVVFHKAGRKRLVAEYARLDVLS